MSPPVTGDCHRACLLLPEMTEAEYRELVEDIRINGLRDPILFDQDNLILDGRHRWRACQELGIEPPQEIYAPPLAGDELEAAKIALVISRNLHRRHLTTQQRAAIGAELATMKSGTRTDLAPFGAVRSGISDAQSAELMGVSERSVERAKARMRTDPEAHQQAKAGTLRRRPAVQRPKPVDGDRERTKSKRSLLDAMGALVAWSPAAAQRYIAEHPDEARKIADMAGSVERIAAVVGKPRFNRESEDGELTRQLIELIEDYLVTRPATPSALYRALQMEKRYWGRAGQGRRRGR